MGGPICEAFLGRFETFAEESESRDRIFIEKQLILGEIEPFRHDVLDDLVQKDHEFDGQFLFELVGQVESEKAEKFPLNFCKELRVKKCFINMTYS